MKKNQARNGAQNQYERLLETRVVGGYDNTSVEGVAENRRGHVRIPIATVAHVTPKGLRVSNQVFVRDISVYGMGGYTTVRYRKGELLEVHLKIDRTNEASLRGVIQGEIRWSNPVDKGKRFAFGLQFREPQMAREQPLLYRHLKELEEMFHPY